MTSITETEHDCLESLEYHELDCMENMDCEVDGAIDRWTEIWWECEICGEKFTRRELDRMHEQREAKEKEQNAIG